MAHGWSYLMVPDCELGFRANRLKYKYLPQESRRNGEEMTMGETQVKKENSSGETQRKRGNTSTVRESGFLCLGV